MSVSFTIEEQQALQSLRQRCDPNHDCFTRREYARLCFLRWLYRTGRLAP